VFWAAARARHGAAAGTKALIEVLLLHRRMLASLVIAGDDHGAGGGAVAPRTWSRPRPASTRRVG